MLFRSVNPIPAFLFLLPSWPPYSQQVKAAEFLPDCLMLDCKTRPPKPLPSLSFAFFYPVNSTRSLFPRTDAARSSVERVTDLLEGSINRSSPAQLVFIRLAISVFVSLWRFISRSIWNVITRLTAVASTACSSCSFRRKSSKLLPIYLLASHTSPGLGFIDNIQYFLFYFS